MKAAIAVAASLLASASAQGGILDEAAAFSLEDGNLIMGCSRAITERKKAGRPVPYQGDYTDMTAACSRDAQKAYEKIVTDELFEPATCAQWAIHTGSPFANAPRGMRSKLNDKGARVSFYGTVTAIDDNYVFVQDSDGYSIAAVVPRSAKTFRGELIEVGRSTAGYGTVRSSIEAVNGLGAPVVSRAVDAGCIESPPQPAYQRW